MRLGGQPDALDVRTVGVDGARLHFEVRRGDGTTCAASVPFPRPVVDRRQVRAAVVELYERARAAEGLSDRT